MPEITIYSKAGCQPCRVTKKVMDKKGIPYTDIDISENQDAADMLASLGYQQAPVVVVGESEDSWTGFRKDKIESLEMMMAQVA